MESLEEAIMNSKEYRRLEDEYVSKIDEVMEAYMDGAIDNIQYKIEIDNIEDWFESEIKKIGKS